MGGRSMKLRDYQERTRAKLHKRWGAGARSLLAVGPTGSGKTRLGAVTVRDMGRVLWVAHRRELVSQARKTLASIVGAENVGVLMSGEEELPGARFQVASIETVFARSNAPDRVDVIVLDEAHHFVADSYRTLLDLYPRARVLGLTATPERYDGRPLGDIFEQLVVAAQYSELIEQGHIVPADIVRPTQYLGNDIVLDPLDAWDAYVSHRANRRTFAFFGRVADAERAALRWRARGARAELIEAKTGKVWRDDVIELFGAGRLDVITNVYALTEGVDIPEAGVAVSCRSFQFSGAMLQAFGRVLRSAPGKSRALILDLTGATHLHGLPTEDREYSLEGRAIVPRPSLVHPNAKEYVFSQSVVGGDLEVATLDDSPDEALTGLPVAPATAGRRASISADKLRAIRSKHGKRQVESVLDYRDKLGE